MSFCFGKDTSTLVSQENAVEAWGGELNSVKNVEINNEVQKDNQRSDTLDLSVNTLNV
ncbi:hypothetical protein [Pseudoalteromonas obscura]|uniref:Uncharacterized protein n=1 Tax=Pseudoalteromonas obscura TaxID=3048491 RepID=A0ABT7ERS4_9GAMM|nr:hypothetical protein [Pseudoalteromonas sp. P94(2023)]MDK2597760.1 hypothetical protein [Pseudoalteromonas sp. P94(2023)]